MTAERSYQFTSAAPPYGASYGETFIEQGGHTYDNPYKFNGKELDEETGLYYYGARYYDTKISLWLSVDPLAEKYPGISPYTYTYDNPIVFVDPTGMKGETHYYNKKTGEHVYVDDGFKDAVVLVDNKDWGSVKAAEKSKTFLASLYMKGLTKIKYQNSSNGYGASSSYNLMYIPKDKSNIMSSKLALRFLGKEKIQKILQNFDYVVGGGLSITGIMKSIFKKSSVSAISMIYTIERIKMSSILNRQESFGLSVLKLKTENKLSSGYFYSIQSNSYPGAPISGAGGGSSSTIHTIYDNNGNQLIRFEDYQY